MNYIQSIHDIEKIIGNVLYRQSKLNRKNIMNALSVRGSDLSKFITDTVKQSYELSDLAMLFEVTVDESENSNFTEQLDDRIIQSNAYLVSVYIYGNESMTLAKQLKARLESEIIRSDLQKNDICLSNVSNIASYNEYINDTMWLRADFSITLFAYMLVDNVNEYIKIVKIHFSIFLCFCQ